MNVTKKLPTILFGAFDRHNLGDLLFPHVTARMLGDDFLLYAGLVERDLSNTGGFRTRSISRVAKEFGKSPLNLIHVGGELLTCESWQAAVMLQQPESVQPIIHHFENNPEERAEWIKKTLGVPALAPYTVSRELFPGAANVIYQAVGGVELNGRNGHFRSEVMTKLRSAQDISVRESTTLALLKEYGINARLVPDPAVMVAELFGDFIEERAKRGDIAAMRDSFPQGYLAVQFSADFGDDRTLKEIAAQLDLLAASYGYGVVLFRAGAAPWHDDLECYRRLAEYARFARIKIFNSLNIWDICTLISRSRLYCGSSLHGRIVAMAYGVPRINLTHPYSEGRIGKQAAYASTWELSAMPATTGITRIAAEAQRALAADKNQLRVHAKKLASLFRKEFHYIETVLQWPDE